jgi:type IV secretion system protein VirB9
MKILYRTAILLSLSLSAMWSVAQEARTIKYASKDVPRITTRPRFTTLIVLPEKEHILDYVIGDKDFWVMEGTQNVCYLKPTKAGLSTSVSLMTAAGNIYSFYATSDDNATPDLKLFVEPTDPKILGGMNSAPRFVSASELDDVRRAADAQIEAANQARERFQSEYPVKSIKLDYVFQKNLNPFNVSAIYHDDKFTYIKTNAPEKFSVYEMKDGKPNLVTYDLREGTYIIPKVMNEGYVELGKKRMEFARKG